MKFLHLSLLLLLVIGCVSGYTLKEILEALDKKENQKKAEVKEVAVQEKTVTRNENDEETQLLKKVLELLASKKKEKAEKKTVTYQEARIGTHGADTRNFGPQGEPKERNFGPQGSPKERNFGPQGQPESGNNVQERNFGMYGKREESNIGVHGAHMDDNIGAHGLDSDFKRNFGAYGREMLRTLIDEELEKLLTKSKSREN